MKFKRFVLTLLLINTISFSLLAQPDRCGTDSKKMVDFFLKQSSRKTINTSGKMLSPTSADSLVIPVVVHIIYHTAEQNISDEQIKSQIDVLNEDYAAINATSVDVPDVWKTMLTDSKIRFCLASSTPDSHNTTGITRTYTNYSSFGYNEDSLKYTSLGGEDAWPTNKYLNFWVCNLRNSVLGFALFPGGDPALDGPVVHYQAFGRTGTLLTKYNYGRTATHEIGHYLDLIHVWGDEPYCNMDDQVFDTPVQANYNYCCPKYPQYDACQPTGDGIMFMNYMDYSDDKFMEFFTPGQIARMDSAINDYRSSLYLSQGCSQPFAYPFDLAVEEIISPIRQSLNRCYEPMVRIKNEGSQPVNHFTIEYNILDGNKMKLKVNNVLAAGKDTVITLPEISGKDKINFLEVRILEPDSNTVNNYASRSYHAGKDNVNGCDDGNPLVYPNPVTGYSFCVKSNFTTSQDLVIRVLNLLGEKISEQSVASNPGDVFNINMGKQPYGIYFVQMIGGDDGSRTARVIYIPAESGGSTASPCE